MRHTNATVTINNQSTQITHYDVTKIAVGYRVIYLEYLDDNEIRIRAYGRREFQTLDVINPAVETFAVVLRGEEFKRINAQFEIIDDDTNTDDDENADIDEDTNAEVNASENIEA